jgi:hypothetical protein
MRVLTRRRKDECITQQRDVTGQNQRSSVTSTFTRLCRTIFLLRRTSEAK